LKIDILHRYFITTDLHFTESPDIGLVFEQYLVSLDKSKIIQPSRWQGRMRCNLHGANKRLQRHTRGIYPPKDCRQVQVQPGAWLIRHPEDDPRQVHVVAYDEHRPGTVLGPPGTPPPALHSKSHPYL